MFDVCSEVGEAPICPNCGSYFYNEGFILICPHAVNFEYPFDATPEELARISPVCCDSEEA